MEQLAIIEKDIAKIIAKYDIGRFKKLKPIKTSGNFSFVITTSRGRYFLRLCGRGNRWRSQEEVEGELRLISRLKEENFPIIGFEKMKDDSAIINIKGLNGYLRKFSECQAIEGNPSSRQLISVGRMFGKYHKIVKNFNSGGLRKKINFGIKQTKQYFNQEKGNILQSKFRNKAKFIAVFAQEIDKIKLSSDFKTGMIHEDLGKRHVLWQDNEIAAIIDFDRSYYGYLILDLGQALRGWCFVDDWQKWSQRNSEQFLAGYEAIVYLSEKEKKYLLLAVKFAILERALAFCTRYVYSRRPQARDEKFALDSLFSHIKKVKI